MQHMYVHIKGAIKVTYSLKVVLCVCIYMSLCHMYVGAGSQMAVLGTLEFYLQVFLNHMTWGLGTEFGSHGK